MNEPPNEVLNSGNSQEDLDDESNKILFFGNY